MQIQSFQILIFHVFSELLQYVFLNTQNKLNFKPQTKLSDLSKRFHGKFLTIVLSALPWMWRIHAISYWLNLFLDRFFSLCNCSLEACQYFHFSKCIWCHLLRVMFLPPSSTWVPLGWSPISWAVDIVLHYGNGLLPLYGLTLVDQLASCMCRFV